LQLWGPNGLEKATGVSTPFGWGACTQMEGTGNKLAKEKKKGFAQERHKIKAGGGFHIVEEKRT